MLVTGDSAGQQYIGAGGVGTQRYDPKGELVCNPLPTGTDPRRCLSLRGSGDNINDVLQYYFGGYLQVGGDGIAEDGTAHDIAGVAEPFEELTASLNGPDSADNQDRTSSFISTSGILPADEFKQFESWPAARWDKPGGPFDPHTGSHYVYSQIADVSYKRLTREFSVPAAGGSLGFWRSYDTEHDWDYLTVEARTAGGDDWTTLPDANGHTSASTGESCASGWVEELHPHLAHYQTSDGEGTCTATGTTGEWHAASGSSNGWQHRRWISRPGPVRRSRSSISYINRHRAADPGVPSWTSCSRTVAPRRSRAGWTAGRSPVRPPGARPTPTTSSEPMPRASRSATRSLPRAAASRLRPGGRLDGRGAGRHDGSSVGPPAAGPDPDR